MSVEHTKAVVDGISLTTAIGTLAGALPAIAAFFSLVWTLIRIYETKTVQGWLGRKVTDVGKESD